MAAHSTFLAWEIPWTEEPSRFYSMGLQRVGPDLVTKQQQFLLLYMCTKSLQSCLTVCNPMDCSPPDSLSMEFSRQEYQSGLPCPSSGDLPNSGIKPMSLRSPELAGRSFTTNTTQEAHLTIIIHILIILNCKVPRKSWVCLGHQPSSNEQIESVLAQRAPWDFFKCLQARRLPGPSLPCLLSCQNLASSPESCGLWRQRFR